jgi:hypothetical protein
MQNVVPRESILSIGEPVAIASSTEQTPLLEMESTVTVCRAINVERRVPLAGAISAHIRLVRCIRNCGDYFTMH